MIIFPAQLEGYRSRSTGDRIISFCTYEDHAGDVTEVIQSKIGTEYLVMLVPTGTQEHDAFVSETPEETKTRFQKRMHAIIDQQAKDKGVDSNSYRASIKSELKSLGLIKDSTTELTVKGYAQVISLLLNNRLGQ